MVGDGGWIFSAGILRAFYKHALLVRQVDVCLRPVSSACVFYRLFTELRGVSIVYYSSGTMIE